MKTKSRNVIQDNYTRRGFIAAVDGLHQPLEFVYRPLLPEQVIDLDEACDKATPTERVKLVASALMRQVKEWSEVDDNDKPQAITIDNIRRLNHIVLIRLRRIVAGVEATDIPPDATEGEASEFIQALLNNIAGKPADPAGADRKN